MKRYTIEIGAGQGKIGAKELRPDLFNKDDRCTIAASDRFNMEYKRKPHDEAILEVERKVTKFFQTPVEIDEAMTMRATKSSSSRTEEYSWSGMDLGDGRLIRSQDQWTRWLGPLRVEPIWNMLACSVVLRKWNVIWKAGMVKRTTRTTLVN